MNTEIKIEEEHVFSKEYEIISNIILEDLHDLKVYIKDHTGIEYFEKFNNKLNNYMKIIFLLGSCSYFDLSKNDKE